MSIQKIKTENFQFKRRKTTLWESKLHSEEMRLFDRLMLVAMSVFEWKNLPSGIDPLWIERQLLEQGQLLFFKDENMLDLDGEAVFLVTKFMLNGRKDFYDRPLYRRAFSEHGGYRKDLDNTNSVILYDNIMRTTFSDVVYDFAKELSQVKQVIDSNLNQQHKPYIIGAVEEISAELVNFFEERSTYKPYFIVKDTMLNQLKEAMQLYPTKTELIVTELNDYYNALWNEFMSFCGVGTNSSPKRERLVSAEVDQVGEQSDVFANARLLARQEFCKEVNKLFNCDIQVDFSFKSQQEMKGENDGERYDRVTNDPQKSSKG